MVRVPSPSSVMVTFEPCARLRSVCEPLVAPLCLKVVRAGKNGLFRMAAGPVEAFQSELTWMAAVESA